jgi:integrase
MSTALPLHHGPALPALRAPLSAYEFFETVYRLEHLAASPETTLIQYRIALRHLDRYRPPDQRSRPLAVDDFTREAVLHCRAGLLADKRTKATANKVVRHLMAVWRCAHEEGYAAEEPRTIKKIKEEKRAARAWTVDEMGRILLVASGMTGQVCGIRASVWWTAFFLVLYDTGLRISSVMDLRWEHFDDRGMEFRVPAEIVKDDEELVLALSAQTLSAIRALGGTGAIEIFPWPYDRDHCWRTLRDHMRRIQSEAGLKWRAREGGFHQYRRTTASYLNREGGDATEHLGHSTREVTKVYLDKRICHRRRQVDLLPRPKLAEPDPQLRLF